MASCVNLPVPGDMYNMTVYSIVGSCATSTSSSIDLVALPSAVNISEGCSNNTVISATWTIPNSVVDTFDIMCSAGTASPASIPLESSPTSDTFTASCTELPTPGLEYNLSVVAISNNKQSAIQTVGVHAWPTGVVNLTEGSASTTSVSANWTGSKRAVDRFSISCSHGDASPATIEDTSQSSYMASCVNLPVPGDMYNMTVYSIVGSCATSTSSSIDLVALPSAVNISEGCSNNTVISATWKIPNSVVDTFDIMCSAGTASPASIPLESSPTSDTFTASCTELPTPGLEYNLSVVAISNNKQSAIQTVGVHAWPTGVVNLTEGSASTTSVSANWTGSKRAVDRFSISCSHGDASPATIEDTSQSSYMASCVNLPLPGDMYNMTVYSIVGSCATSPSSSIDMVALPSAVNISEGCSNNTVISATWTIPNSVVDTFDIMCSAGTASPTSIPLESSPTSDTFTASCTELPTPGLEYNLSVVAISNNKQSAIQTVGVHAWPTGVVNLTEGSASTTSVSANWTGSKRAVDRFSISCSHGDASPATIEDTSQSSYMASCVNLPVPGDMYNMTVYSIVGSCATSPSSSIDLVALPSAVNISEGCSNNTVISATWTIPNSVVDTFDIMCSAGTASPASIPLESSPTSDTFTSSCTELPTPGLEYNLSVVAISNNKQSAIQTVGVHAWPAGVVNLTEGSASTTSVSANWTGPKKAVESFSISCSHGDASPATIEVTMPEAVTLNEESSMVTTSTITASWTMPDGTVEYYEVSCSDGTASPAIVDSSDALIASCIGLLTPGDNYTISVTSVSNGKLSAASTITITALPPEAVTLREEIEKVTTTTITASWDMPNGIVEYYEVSCSNGTASPAKDYSLFEFIASCTGLSSPGDNFTIAVTSVSNSQYSAASTITITASLFSRR
eukprot:XP_011670404.1 PREDICTED: fibronectin-like [Strongylocentrotus purpuratus]